MKYICHLHECDGGSDSHVWLAAGMLLRDALDTPLLTENEKKRKAILRCIISHTQKTCSCACDDRSRVRG